MRGDVGVSVGVSVGVCVCVSIMQSLAWQLFLVNLERITCGWERWLMSAAPCRCRFNTHSLVAPTMPAVFLYHAREGELDPLEPQI